jgi:hypothetical protein
LFEQSLAFQIEGPTFSSAYFHGLRFKARERRVKMPGNPRSDDFDLVGLHLFAGSICQMRDSIGWCKTRILAFDGA